MNLPREILIGPHLYRVRSGRKAREALGDLMGQCDTRGSVIDVHPQQSGSQAADTLLHEILHACYDQTSLRQGGDADGPSPVEEAVVSALTPILLSTLRANPELVKVLTGG